MSRPKPVSDESGITIIELLVGMVIGIAVLGGVVTLVTTTARSSGRISERVAVDQIARPMVQRIMDELHSTCVSPNLAPIQAGSTGSSITFIHALGSAVSPTPEKRTIALVGTNLVETRYASTGGTAPAWTFSSTPTSTYRLLERVGQIGSTPIFSYYAYEDGQISDVPLPTPLSAGDAAIAVQADISLAVWPSDSATSDEDGAPVEITNSVLVRFSPSNEDTDQAGLPCS